MRGIKLETTSVKFMLSFCRYVIRMVSMVYWYFVLHRFSAIAWSGRRWGSEFNDFAQV